MGLLGTTAQPGGVGSGLHVTVCAAALDTNLGVHAGERLWLRAQVFVPECRPG